MCLEFRYSISGRSTGYVVIDKGEKDVLDVSIMHKRAYDSK